MAKTASVLERPDANLIKTLLASNVHPLLDRYQTIIPVKPSAADALDIAK